MHLSFLSRLLLPAALVLVLLPFPGRADPDGWIDLTRLDAWKAPRGEWFLTDSVRMDPANPKKLTAEPGGKTILVNGPKGRSRDLVSQQVFRDIEVHVEFLIPKGSNSGVKFEELYEIQILDSYGKKKVTGDDCGGIYPRAEAKPKYHHIDEGIPPRTNAARPAGEWQTLDAIFLAPRLDATGKKVANAKLVKVVLNGQVIHENVELKTPTGANWTKKEPASGRLLLQGDHGPVAFRNVRVRPLNGAKQP